MWSPVPAWFWALAVLVYVIGLIRRKLKGEPLFRDDYDTQQEPEKDDDRPPPST